MSNTLSLKSLSKAQLNEKLPAPYSSTELRKVKKAELLAQVEAALAAPTPAPEPEVVATPTAEVQSTAAPAVAAEPTVVETELTLPEPSDDQIRVRAKALYEAGRPDPVANWYQARREATIALRAFERWRAHGGEALDNWLAAEREVNAV